jgi:FtsP/CotA-like multicopper oxidase with cupredoxin domain
MKRRRTILNIFACVMVMALAQICASAQTPVPPVSNPCPRSAPGSVIHQPPALFSSNGVLNVQFSYQTTTDAKGRQLFCFMTPSGMENPTLHVRPGDTLNITVTNNTPTNLAFAGSQTETFNAPTCGDTQFQQQGPSQDAQGFNITGGSMNIHYHGTNTTPACHGDNVVKTLINSGHTFSYSLQFPTNEPPGLYWYHPHVHGLAEAAVQGGAAGALIVDGINNIQPAVANLRHRVIMIRDQPTNQLLTQSAGGTEGGIPQLDLTVNNVSINTTTNTTTGVTSYTPAVIRMAPGEPQFWRICNCTSDAPLDLQVRFDGVAQTIQLVGIDAVPVNSQDGTAPGHLIPVTRFRIPPAARVEFIVPAPSSTVHVAQLVAALINTGPLGDDIPTRPLLNMQLTSNDISVDNDTSVDNDRVATDTTYNPNLNRFAGISNVTPALTRTVFFEEVEDGSAFFINMSKCVTASGANCGAQPYAIDTPFDSNNPPAFITTQGTVEKWIIENHARENHELHQHQIHFKVLSQNNFEVNGSPQAPGINGQFLDMVEVPFCGGDASPTTPTPPACLTANNGGPPLPYPNVTALMDFRGPDVGDFVFHCHILGHEDRGMMAIERVVCPSTGCH